MAIGFTDPRSPCWARHWQSVSLSGRKHLKSLAIFSIFASMLGCGSQAIVPPKHDEMIQLEEKNSRLEAEVTELREKILSEKRKVDTACTAAAAKSAPHIDKQELEPVETPPELAVVRLEPEHNPDEPDENPDFGQNLSSPGSPNSDEPLDESTRPVLKVHGRHEARVYHRPLDAADALAQ